MATYGQSSQKQFVANQRRFRVLKSVLAGASERQIAEREGVSASLIHKDKRKVLSDLAKEHVGLADEVRAVQMERYNQLMLRWWGGAMQGEKEATDVVLRVMKEINVINGIIPDKPLISFSQFNSYSDNQITFEIDTNDNTNEQPNSIQATQPVLEAEGSHILE